MKTSKGMSLPSVRLITSYIFDWIVIILMAGIAGGLEYKEPFRRPFSPVDLSISFPFEEHETIPVWLLVIISLIVPLAVIMVVCLVFVPGPTIERGTSKSLIWKRKMWEWHTGWMGLCLSLATAFLVTQGMKNLFGKPRPDLLSRCQPDLSRIREFAVNPVGEVFDPAWVLVTSGICTNTNEALMRDGFRSYPSGHSSFSWAGLLYLTLFLASKFSIAIPFLHYRPFSTNPAYTSAVTPSNLGASSTLPFHKQESTLSSPTSYGADDAIVPIRYQDAAPPVYTLILILVPIGVSIYITSTRYSDFRHFPFDMLFGTFIGVVCAWFSFRWYHLPISRGAGWAWGPRSKERAWGIGVGRGTYVGAEGWSRTARREAAAGRQVNGNENTNGVDESEMGVLNRNGAPHAGNPANSFHSRNDVSRVV